MIRKIRSAERSKEKPKSKLSFESTQVIHCKLFGGKLHTVNPQMRLAGLIFLGGYKCGSY